MKFHRIIALLLVIAPVLSVSCKKDEEEEVGEYLSGSIDLVFPSYVTSGYTKQFRIDTMSTLYRGDKLHKVGYYFTNPTTGKSDTVVFDGGVANPDFPDGVYTFTAPDKLARYSISVTGYSKDYYVKSASVSFVVVDPRLDGKGSITGFELEDDSPLFVDPRDSRRYYTTTVEGKEWFRQNLGWEGAGKAYKDADAMSYIFGRYYTWNEARTACPPGWRLPSDEEWMDLAAAHGGAAAPDSYDIAGAAASLMEDLKFNGETMWEYWPDVKIDNAAKFSAMPVGYATVLDGVYDFFNYGDYTVFWTSTENEDGDSGIYRYIYVDKNIVFRGTGDKDSFAASVRCVR